MGVDATNYVIYGFVLDKEQKEYVKKNWSDDDLPVNQYIEGAPETCGHILLMDGMCDKYIIFGKVLAHSNQYQADDIQKIVVPNYKDEASVRKHFLNCFPQQFKFESNIELLFVTHNS